MEAFSAPPVLSVVLPVLNEARDLPRLLEEIFSQQPPPGGFEVLVADGGSVDGTREIVLEYAARGRPVRLLDNPGRLSSAGRNVGAMAARGEFVLFLDGHCALPRPDLFRRTVELFQSTGADALCRPQPLDRLHDRGWGEAISRARHSWFGHAAGSDIYGGEPGETDPRSAGAAYRRRCLEELGYYDTRFDACEDVEFNHRVYAAGKRAWRHPDLAVHYRPREDLKGLFRQMFRYGRGRARLLARHGVLPLPLLAYTLALLVLGASAFLLSTTAAAFLLLVGLGAWILVAAVAAFGVSRGHPLMALRVLAALAVVHLGLVSGFWRGLGDFFRYRTPAGAR